MINKMGRAGYSLFIQTSTHPFIIQQILLNFIMLCIQHCGWNDEKQPLYLSCEVYSQERKADINYKRIKPTNITIVNN